MFNTALLSFLFFLILTLLVGIFSYQKAESNSEDYLLAGRSVNPYIMALSSFSTTNSGYMFIAYIGYTYIHGISSLWYLITWISGEFLAWKFIHPLLRIKSEKEKLNTLSSFISGPEPKQKSSLVKITALISFIFLGVYAAVQLKIANKALFVLTDWDTNTGIIIAGLIVAVYCFSGGIRASIWTDVFQTFLMLGAMFTVLALAIFHVGGLSELFSNLQNIDPEMLQWISPEWKGHFVILLLSLALNGFGVIGQPHIMIRAMTINHAANLQKARNIYLLCYVFFGLASWLVGLSSRVLVPNLSPSKAELALPILAENLLNPIMLGMILAGIFSAALSTADSQIISCSANLTQDLFPKLKSSYLASKISTLTVAFFVVLIAIFFHDSIFNLILVSWAVLAASLGPLIFMRCFGIKFSEKASIASVLLSSTAVILWRYLFHLSPFVHEVLVGVLVGTLIIILFKDPRIESKVL